MVSAFFRSAPTGLDHIVTQAVGMLGDARHSFDQATSALLLGTDPAMVESDILETDRRINTTEQELRSELVVHVTVSGSVDIGSVLGLTLLLKKIERIGDQAKNVLDVPVEALPGVHGIFAPVQVRCELGDGPERSFPELVPQSGPITSRFF